MKSARRSTIHRRKGSSRHTGRKWSGAVTRNSNAMDIRQGTFSSDDPKEIAQAVKRASENSGRRKASPYRSAVSMISFYENRGGKNLPPQKHRVLRQARAELKKKFQRD